MFAPCLLRDLFRSVFSWLLLSVSICQAQVNFDFFQPVHPSRDLQVVQESSVQLLPTSDQSRAFLACVEAYAEDYIEWTTAEVNKSPAGDLRVSEAETLAELLQAAHGRINLLLECGELAPESLLAEIVAAKMERQVLISGSADFLQRLRNIAGEQVARLEKDQAASSQEHDPKWPEGVADFVTRLRPAAVDIAVTDLNAELCQSFQTRGVKVLVTTGSQMKSTGEWDRPAHWRAALAVKADFIRTGRAHEVRFLEARQRLGEFPVKIAFHRGANRYAPENTVASIQQAVALGADYVEVDARTSSDGECVLMHDRTVDRTAVGSGIVAELPYATLANLDVGSRFGIKFNQERVATLAVGMKTLGTTTGLYLDAKAISPEAIVSLLLEHDLQSRHVVYQSLEFCRRLKELSPDIRTLPPLRTVEELETVVATSPHGVDTAWNILSPSLIERCHAEGVQVFTDALGEHETVEDYLQAIAWKVDVIQTDHPLRLLRAIELAALRAAEPPLSEVSLAKIVAHRGGVVEEGLIENNLPAIAESIRRGYSMLEIDIRESLDGHLVVHHDADFNRFYNDGRRVAESTWEQIQQIHAESGERPLDLAEFAKACQGRIQLMLDVKGPEHPPKFFEEIESILEKHAMLTSFLVIGTRQAKDYFRSKAKVGLNSVELSAAVEAGEPVSDWYFLFEHGEDLDEGKIAQANQLGVTIVPSINIFHYAGDGNHWLLARRDIRRLRALGVEYFQIDSVYDEFVKHAPTAPSDRVRLNEIQTLGTHNSYHLAMPHAALSLIEKQDLQLAQSLDYSHLPLAEQLDSLGMRQIELDVFADPQGGKYAKPRAREMVAAAGMGPLAEHDPEGLLNQPGLKVLHVQDVDYQTRALTFVQALHEIRQWSLDHPWHVPILILVEAKDEWITPIITAPHKFDAAALNSIDDEIRSVFSTEELITPDMVRGQANSLREAILAQGWPDLEEVRGKVLFALDNEGEIRDRYLAEHPGLEGRAMFVSVDEEHPAAAFRKINDPIANFAEIQAAVRKGFIVRTRADADTRQARDNDTTRRQRAFTSGAQFISTDYPVPDQRFSGYHVALPGKVVARPNPINGQDFSPALDLDK